MKNIVLIGMMGSGKNIIGRQVAALSGLEFFDTDEIIREQTGLTLTKIFDSYGEPRFRGLETAACEILSVRSNLLIATGSSVIMRAENIRRLKENGIIILIDKPLPLLIRDVRLDDRPMLENGRNSLQKIYDERIGLYRSSADITLPHNGEDAEVIDAIMKIINEQAGR